MTVNLRYNHYQSRLIVQDTKLSIQAKLFFLVLAAACFTWLPQLLLAQQAAPPPTAEGALPQAAAPTALPPPLGLLLQPLTPPVPAPTSIQVIDRPNDDGSTFLVLFELPQNGADNAAPADGATASDGETRINAEVQITADGRQEWRKCLFRPLRFDSLSSVAESPEFFGYGVERAGSNSKYPAGAKVLEASRYIVPGEGGDFETVGFKPGEEYTVRLVVRQGEAEASYDAGQVKLAQSFFNGAALNNVIFCIVFTMIILGFILAARRNPNLFIRRIQGLEAVDEAIGRATEMGKPVLHINGLDPLSTLATLAAVNILGRIARRVANYDSTLLVPCFDPVVMTVSQEVVRNAYLEAGRPDAYREDNIFFLTDQQFSYTASTCGIMVREKPAAIFLLGYFYAESLMLAETGYSVGAIQIAGTDAQSQLPFFITTCDYTLIGEELYAASAYLSREPMLLGSLKGQDVGKAFVMVIIVIGTILATLGILFPGADGQGVNWEWLNQMLTPLV